MTKDEFKSVLEEQYDVFLIGLGLLEENMQGDTLVITKTQLIKAACLGFEKGRDADTMKSKWKGEGK